MIFHQFQTEQGCQSYIVGCDGGNVAALIDPELSLMERYIGVLAHDGLRLAYVIDTHTHADHFSASKQVSEKLDVPVAMHRNSPAPFVDMHVDDGELIIVGELRIKVLHTPGHTEDSMCLHVEDRVFTGDTLLIGGTGRTDLPTGNPDQLFDSLFNKLLLLDPETRVYPAHIYSNKEFSTIGEEIESNQRLQKSERSEFVQQMRELDLKTPTHLTEALRTNLYGGKTVSQFINDAARSVSFMSLEEVLGRLDDEADPLQLLDVREKSTYEKGHIPGAIHAPRGQLELRVNELLPDPTKRIVVYCEFGKISTLAAATLKQMGFNRAVAMDHGFQHWKEKEYPIDSSDP